MHKQSRVHFTVAAALIVAAAAGPRAASRSIDRQSSTLTVHVGKAGLFSAFADDHVVAAAIASGTMSDEDPLAIKLAVTTADLRIVDPNLDPGTRAEVLARMLGSDVLDAARFPEITFESTTIHAQGADRFSVTGRLTIHGTSREVTTSATRVDRRYQGEFRIKQTDFGIAPIRIAGGTVRVKDELRIRFDIVPEPAR
jgi:polyisoprenoid-binding protein YceI